MENQNAGIGRNNKIKRAEAMCLALKDPSLYVLLFSNAVTMYFAIAEHWSAASVLFVYWQQSVIIGFFNFIKIIQLKNFSTEGFEIGGKQPLPKRATKIKTAFFFLFHYGFFHFVYFMVIIAIAEMGAVSWSVISEEMPSLQIAAAIFFLNHLFSYLYHKPWAVEKQNLGTVMIYPYVRIIPMHFISLLWVPVQIFFGSAGVTMIFLVFKTYIDAIMHIAEHAKSRSSAVDPDKQQVT